MSFWQDADPKVCTRMMALISYANLVHMNMIAMLKLSTLKSVHVNQIKMWDILPLIYYDGVLYRFIQLRME